MLKIDSSEADIMVIITWNFHNNIQRKYLPFSILYLICVLLKKNVFYLYLICTKYF